MVSLLWENDFDQKLIRVLGLRVWSLLNADRKQQAEATGGAVKYIITPKPHI